MRLPILLITAAATLGGLAQSALAADADIDTVFGDQGWVVRAELNNAANDARGVAVARTPDGNYLLLVSLDGGSANNYHGQRIGLYKFTPSGDPVTTFGGGTGHVYKDANFTSVKDMAIDSQGRIVVIGATPDQNNSSNFGVVRFNPNGSNDISFAGDGDASFGFDVTAAYSYDNPTSLLIETDDSLVILGDVYTADTGRYRYGVINVQPDGSRDPNFGNFQGDDGADLGTLGEFVAGENVITARIVPLALGEFGIVGSTLHANTEPNYDFAMTVIYTQGNPVPGANATLVVPLDVSAGKSDIASDAVRSDVYHVLLVGSTAADIEYGQQCAAMRVLVTYGATTQLQLDPSFAGSNLRSHPNIYLDNVSGRTCASAAIRSDGRMLLVGGYTADGQHHDGWAMRLLADGTPDNSFTSIGTSFAYYNWNPPLANNTSSYFNRAFYDGTNAVIAGTVAQNAAALGGLSGALTRLQGDRIFANGFE